MVSKYGHDASSSTARAQFATTQWSLVIAAGQPSAAQGREALATLCRAYWYPLYAYARRRVTDVHEAQDLTQAFFTRLLEKNLVAAVNPERGRFRSFLLTSFKNFLANEWDKAMAKKRGGGKPVLSLDFVDAESRYGSEASEHLSPERLYDRQWVLRLLDRVLDDLEESCKRDGKSRQFALLSGFIAGPPSQDAYAAVAGELGITEGAAKVAAHRLRKRYQKLLRDEIAQTVAEPEQVEDEIRFLFAALEQ